MALPAEDGRRAWIWHAAPEGGGHRRERSCVELHRWLVPPAGLEPAHPAPEAGALIR
jgi:hypothetical protein